MIASIDPDSRLIYLDASTVGAAVNPVDLYKEMRTLRANDESLRGYDVFLKAYGNVEKGGGKYTERYVQTIGGTKIVPYDTSHVLSVTGTIITDDGYEGVYCFDRTQLSLATVVDINYVPPQVEVITVTTGSGVTEQDKADIASEVWSAAIRTLTSAGAGGATAQEVWEYNQRELTSAIVGSGGLDEAELHTALDNYTNKDAYKADVSNLSADVNVVEVNGVAVTSVDDFKADTVTVDVSGLEAKVDAVLADTADMQPRVIEIEERTAEIKTHTDSLYNYTGLHAELDSYVNKDDWKADQTSELNILTAINGLNDISALDVRNVFDASDFQAKNTETEIHTWLDTYGNKNNWKAIIPEVDTDVNVISVNGVAVAGPDDLKSAPTDVSGIAGDVWSYMDRDLTVTTGLTALQDAKLDGILTDTANMQPKMVEVEQRTVDVLNQVNTLSNYSTLHQDLDNYVNKDDWKGDATSITPVLSAINALNDVSAAEVRAEFNVEDFKSKNTENEIHTYLDSYLNKDNWKADVSATQNVLDAVNGLNNLSLAEVEGSTVLAKSIALSAVASDITSLINDGYTVNLDPVLTVLTGMNDVSAADVRAAFDENEFKDKNTESELHAWLDSYMNKDDWKAVVPAVDLGPILSAIGALNNLSLIDIEGSTVLAKKATLDAIVASVAQIPTELVDLTPVTDGIAGLNDVTPAEVRAAFNAAEFKDKNTELEIHTWLDSYTGKENWGGTLTTTTKTELTTEIWDKVI